MHNYLLSQIFVVISMICMGSTFICKEKRNILLLCVIYGVFYGAHYFLLNAMTGFFMNFVAIMRNIWFFINARRGVKNSKIVLAILIVFSLGMGFLSFQDWFSFLSIIASILSTYSVWQDKVKLYRILAVPVSLCFIIYGFHIKSLFSIVSEFLLLGIEIIGLFDFYIKYRKNLKLEENNI